MALFLLIAVGGLLGLLYALMVMGFVDRMPQRQLQALRHAMTVLILTAGVWGALQGAFLLLLVCVLFGIPLARHLLNPDRDLLAPELAGQSITRAEALQVLELDEDEVSAEAVGSAYARLLALVPDAKRARSYYARRLQLARDCLLASPAL